jgi:hypothetical protein
MPATILVAPNADVLDEMQSRIESDVGYALVLRGYEPRRLPNPFAQIVRWCGPHGQRVSIHLDAQELNIFVNTAVYAVVTLEDRVRQVQQIWLPSTTRVVRAADYGDLVAKFNAALADTDVQICIGGSYVLK